MKQTGELPSATPLNVRMSGRAEGNSRREERNRGDVSVEGCLGSGRLGDGSREEAGPAASNKACHRTAGRLREVMPVMVDTGPRRVWRLRTAAGELFR